MRWFAQIAFQVKSLFSKRKLDEQLSEEIRTHVDLATEANIAAGMKPVDARYAALREFGNVASVGERARDARGWAWLEQFGQDLRHGVRALSRSPGFTFAVVAILAVAIGLVTAIVNVAMPILVPALPFPDQERLVVLRERPPESVDVYHALLPYRFAEYAKHSNSFTALGAELSESLNLVAGGEPYAVRVSSVTEGFFAALAVACEQGRTFLPEDHSPARAGDTVVVSHAAWDKFFGRDPALLGGKIQLGDRLRQVIGILPPGFRITQLFPGRRGDDGIYLAMPYETAPVTNRSVAVSAVGRLKPGITREQAEAELATIHPLMPPQSPALYQTLRPCLMFVAESLRGSRAMPFRIFLVAAGLLYLIGCTAVANLMLSRAVARRRELGVRLALGGSRRRIMTLLLAESMVLGVLGGTGGALIALWVRSATARLAPADMSADELLVQMIAGRAFAMGLFLGLLTCVVAALAPAWRAGRMNLNEAMKEGTGTRGESRRAGFVRGVLVAIQCALAVVLLIGAGLLFKTVYRLQRIELGFVPEQRLVIQGYRKKPPASERLDEANRLILERVAALPGVRSAAFTTTVPALGSAMMSGVQIEGRGAPEVVPCYIFNVTPGYFSSMGMPMLAGRGFEDLHRGDRPVVVIDEIMARQYFPGQNPIGRFLAMRKDQLEIVGVVRRVAISYRGGTFAKTAFTKTGSAAPTSDNEISAQIYVPSWQGRLGSGINLIIHLDPESATGFGPALRRAVFELDPTVVVTIQSLDDVVGGWSRQERQALAMLQVLAGLALGFAAIGVFSVMAYAVDQRRGEFGVRLVLGATPGDLTASVVRRGVQLAGWGILSGLLAAAALGRYLQSVLYETSPNEPLVYLIVVGLLIATTILACWLPARRAAKVDPIFALRAE